MEGLLPKVVGGCFVASPLSEVDAIAVGDASNISCSNLVKKCSFESSKQYEFYLKTNWLTYEHR